MQLQAALTFVEHAERSASSQTRHWSAPRSSAASSRSTSGRAPRIARPVAKAGSRPRRPRPRRTRTGPLGISASVCRRRRRHAASPMTAGHPSAIASRPAVSSVGRRRTPPRPRRRLIASAVCGDLEHLAVEDVRAATHDGRRARDESRTGERCTRVSTNCSRRPTRQHGGSRRSRSTRRRAIRSRSSARISASTPPRAAGSWVAASRSWSADRRLGGSAPRPRRARVQGRRRRSPTCRARNQAPRDRRAPPIAPRGSSCRTRLRDQHAHARVRPIERADQSRTLDDPAPTDPRLPRLVSPIGIVRGSYSRASIGEDGARGWRGRAAGACRHGSGGTEPAKGGT